MELVALLLILIIYITRLHNRLMTAEKSKNANKELPIQTQMLTRRHSVGSKGLLSIENFLTPPQGEDISQDICGGRGRHKVKRKRANVNYKVSYKKRKKEGKRQINIIKSGNTTQKSFHRSKS
jgi:hypothetical protein